MNGRAKMGNKGFTLVEIMLSIAILALISVPLMKYFSDSLRYAAQTAEKQKATMIAQETVEFIKSQKKIVKPVTTSATTAPDPSATPVVSANYMLAPELAYLFGGYVLATTPDPSNPSATAAPTPEIITPAQFDATGATLDLVGNSDPLIYRYTDQKSGKYYIEVMLNCITPADDVSSPAILNIDDSKNVVIAERTEEMDAITHFSTLNINQYMSWNGGMLEDPNMSPSPTPDEFIYVTMSPDPDDPIEVTEYKQLSESEIRENMDRIIYVTITKGASDPTFTVNAYYQFFCKDVFGPGTHSDMEYPSATLCEASVEKLEGIFLMFNKMSNTRDYIQVIWNVDDPHEPYPDFRFVVQDDIATDEEGDGGDEGGDVPGGDEGGDVPGGDEGGDVPGGDDDEEEIVDPAGYVLEVDWFKFVSDDYTPTVHSNLPAGSFKFNDNLIEPIKKPNDTSVALTPRGDISVYSLTGSGVPVRIFDLTVKVYKDKKAFEDEPLNPLVELNTSKVE